MERLTMRIAGVAAMAREHEEMHTIPEWIDMLHNRLADYEDTGLTPEQVVDLMGNYANAIGALAQIRGQLDRIVEKYGLYHDGMGDAITNVMRMLQDKRLIPVPAPGDVLYEADPEHGVVKHTVTDVHWVANTTAVDDDGKTWADYYTDEDIGMAQPTREAALLIVAAASNMEG